MRRDARSLTWFSAVWLLMLLVIEFVIAERNPLTAAVTYIPQHPLALPLLPGLLAGLFRKQWKLLAVNLLLAAFFVIVFMGFNVGPPGDRNGDLRVMTVNIHRSQGNPNLLVKSIEIEKPDVLFLQEANPLRPNKDALKQIVDARHWHIAKIADVAILSRFPLSNVRSVVLFPRSGRGMLIAEVSTGKGKITVACAHFATNRVGATRRHLRSYLRDGAKCRTAQARVLVAHLPNDSAIVAGDFNLPPRGLAFRGITAKYRDTFAAGAGFGYTYRARLPVMRIDHVLASPDLTPTRWRAVDTGGTDHRAVVVDLQIGATLD